MGARAIASLERSMVASPPDWLCMDLVGADGLEPPTLSV